MKKLAKHCITIFLVFFIASAGIFAQINTSGTVKYEKVTKLVYKNPWGKKDGNELEEWFKTLPKTNKTTKMLYFNNESSVFEDEDVRKEEHSIEMKKAMWFTKGSKAPVPELKKVYYNFEKNKKIEQLLFMTRMFLIESDIEKKNWKITGESKESKDVKIILK